MELTRTPCARFPLEVQPVIDDLLPLCRALGEGRYAVSLGGSYGKQTSDRRSDLDFRLFCERRAPDQGARRALAGAIQRWAESGVVIDGCWVRTIDEVEANIARLQSGEIIRDDRVWTIWGYQLLTDVYNQAVIEDPYGILAAWHARLDAYPQNLKAAILEKHLASLRYWRHDYHYANKVKRRDIVFLAGITSKLLNDVMRVLFALNETYYPGDGKNLHFADRFDVAPFDLRHRVEAILYPGRGAHAVPDQHRDLMALIDDVLALVESDVDGPANSRVRANSAATASSNPG